MVMSGLLQILLALEPSASAGFFSPEALQAASQGQCGTGDMDEYNQARDQAGGWVQDAVSQTQKELDNASSLPGELAGIDFTPPPPQPSFPTSRQPLQKAIDALQHELSHMQSNGQKYLDAYGAGIGQKKASVFHGAMRDLAQKLSHDGDKSISKLKSADDGLDAVEGPAQALNLRSKIDGLIQRAEVIAKYLDQSLADAATQHSYLANCGKMFESRDLSSAKKAYYGNGIGEHSRDQNFGHFGHLQPGDVALSPDLLKQHPYGSMIEFDGQMYRVADVSYVKPGVPNHNTVEFYVP
jgi:hypothetical protein